MAFNAKFNFSIRLVNHLNFLGWLAVLINTVLVAALWFTSIPIWIPTLSTLLVVCGLLTGYFWTEEEPEPEHILDESGNEYVPPTPQPPNQGITL